jgi:hypothetical protein
MTVEERGIRELQDLVGRAQSQLAGLQFLCKLLFLRVGQVQQRSPNLNGLIAPMEVEIAEILDGVIGAQIAHSEMEKIVTRML